MQQSADQSAFAVIYAAAGNKPQQLAVIVFDAVRMHLLRITWNFEQLEVAFFFA